MKQIIVIILTAALLFSSASTSYAIEKKKKAVTPKTDTSQIQKKQLSPSEKKTTDDTTKKQQTDVRGFNDFQDSNKNGVDDRLEKRKATSPKPIVPPKVKSRKPGEVKKAITTRSAAKTRSK